MPVSGSIPAVPGSWIVKVMTALVVTSIPATFSVGKSPGLSEQGSGSGNPPARVARAAMATGLPGPKAPPLALVDWSSESFRERRSAVSRASATDFSDVERCTAVVRRRTVPALVGQLRTKQIISGK